MSDWPGELGELKREHERAFGGSDPVSTQANTAAREMQKRQAEISMQMAAQQQYRGLGSLHPQSLRENVERQLQNARAEVDRLNELLNLMDQNPDIPRALELLQQPRY